MISIVMPTLNAAADLRRSLPGLVAGAVSGLVKQLVVCDGGSRDDTLAIAEAAGADVVKHKPGRGGQLRAGAEAATGEWLLFLHADTVLKAGWEEPVRRFIADQADDATAGYFRLRLDDARWRARVLETIVAMRCRLLALPYGDQGLLISRAHYDRVGGFADMVLMEDVDMVRRIGRPALAPIGAVAETSAERYRREGYVRRMARNAMCLTAWYAGMAPERIARLYA